VIGQESQSWSAAWLGAVWRGWKVKEWSYRSGRVYIGHRSQKRGGA